MSNNKFALVCQNCDHRINDVIHWYELNQVCPRCGSVEIQFSYSDLTDLIKTTSKNASSNCSGMWRYFSTLPIAKRESIVCAGEGNVELERWKFLEEYALEYGIQCRVFAHRYDNSPATGTFKDLSGSMVASVLKENGIRGYVVASTGNIGVALSHYLAAVGLKLSVFVPSNSSYIHDWEIRRFGQQVYRAKGDYAVAKRLARNFANRNGFHMSPNGYDPIRLEAKKTMAYEWVKRNGDVPDVYIQAVSGGIGPIGVQKGVKELQSVGITKQQPRYLLVQTDRCNPMAASWDMAKKGGFPEHWEQHYNPVASPKTTIATLATGEPILYPILAPIVKESQGQIIAIDETKVDDIARLVALEMTIRIGPASAVAVGGFVSAIHHRYIRSCDDVVIAIGEGIMRAPEFVQNLATSTSVSSIEDCVLHDKEGYRRWLLESLSEL